MQFNELDIPGVLFIENFINKDDRGVFIKPFTSSIYKNNNLYFEIKEIYFSISKKNVIRGMHFQKPPMDCSKLIFITRGKIIDVLLDLRESSPTYKQYIDLTIDSSNNAILIPPGIAHGFLSLENETTVIYNQSKPYSNNHDEGILWDSFGYNWDVENPIISDRDKNFNPLTHYNTPFN